MAKVAEAFTSYDAQGNREDLSNAIYNIDPFDTPVMSSARRRNVKQRTYDWQMEHLPDVDPDNAEVEGFELTRAPSQPTIRLNNNTQISHRDATVSGSQEETEIAGKSSEMAHQMALKSKVLKSDMEVIACGLQARVAGDDAGPVARKTESITHWIARGVDREGNDNAAVVGYTAAGLPTTATGTYTAAGAVNEVAFTELMLGDAMELAYDHGASPNLLVCPPKIKRTVSNFEGRSTTQVIVGKTEVVATVDVIATDFGRIKVIPSRWVPTDIALLLSPAFLALAYFRRFRQYPLGRIGDAVTRMILTEWGTEMRNPMAHILFNGVKKGALIGE